MTRDNAGRTNDWRAGEPGKALAPADVIECRECGGLVRRVNNQHLRARRCRLKDPDGDPDNERNQREDHPTTVSDYKEKHPGAPVVSPREREELSRRYADPETDARRREIVRSRWSGERMTAIVERVAEQHGVAETTVWRDWVRRDEWLPRVFDIDDTSTKLVEILARQDDVIGRLERLAARAESQGDTDEARRILAEVRKALSDQFGNVADFRERAGEAGVSGRASVEVSGRIEHEHRGAPGEELDDETLADIDRLVEDGEVVDAEYTPIEEEPDMTQNTDGEDRG